MAWPASGHGPIDLHGQHLPFLIWRSCSAIAELLGPQHGRSTPLLKMKKYRYLAATPTSGFRIKFETMVAGGAGISGTADTSCCAARRLQAIQPAYRLHSLPKGYTATKTTPSRHLRPLKDSLSTTCVLSCSASSDILRQAVKSCILSKTASAESEEDALREAPRTLHQYCPASYL